MDAGEAEACARTMASSEPWLTLGRSFEKALAVVSNPAKEVWVVPGTDGPRAFVILDMHGAFAGYLQTICVRPEERGRGLGTRLLAWAEARIFRIYADKGLIRSDDLDELAAQLVITVLGVMADWMMSAAQAPENGIVPAELDRRMAMAMEHLATGVLTSP